MPRKQLPVYHIFEKEALMFGLPISDFTTFGAILGALLLVPEILKVMGVGFNWIYYTSVFVLATTLYFFLKRMAKKDYPGFLLSYINTKAIMPKIITTRDDIKLTKDTEYK